jgi:hypothetical protein
MAAVQTFLKGNKTPLRLLYGKNFFIETENNFLLLSDPIKTSSPLAIWQHQTQEQVIGIEN